MKKLSFTLLLALCVSAAAFAQEIPEESAPEPEVRELVIPEPDVQPVRVPRNEIDLSISGVTGLQYVGVYGGMLVSLIGTIFKGDVYVAMPFIIPNLSLEYDRWLTDNIAVGASVSADVLSALPYGFITNLCIMPDFKYKWFERDNFKIYSKLAVGYMTSIWGLQEEDKSMKIGSLSRLTDVDYMSLLSSSSSSAQVALVTAWVIPPFGFQVNPLCFDVSTSAKNLHFFLEMGFGTQGAFALGLKTVF